MNQETKILEFYIIKILQNFSDCLKTEKFVKYVKIYKINNKNYFI